MNLSISPMKSYSNVSFGMAYFTPEGMRLAQESADIYEPLKNYTEFQNPAFFEKTHFYKKPALTSYIEEKLPHKKPIKEENIEEVTKTIVECGATGNAKTNALFVEQMLDGRTQKHIRKLQKRQPDVFQKVLDAEKIVFDSNWNNPLISKRDTTKLLLAVKKDLTDAEYVTLTGVIENSNAMPDKQVKVKPLKVKSKNNAQSNAQGNAQNTTQATIQNTIQN